MPKVSEQHKERRRVEILEAAWRCFGRDGFHQTTIRDICEEAGLSPGAVYQYFDGKAALVQAVAERGRAAAKVRVDGGEGVADPAAALAASLGRYLECLTEPDSRDAIRVDIGVCAEGLYEDTVGDAVLENYEHLFELFGELVERGQEDGSLAPGLSSRAVGRVMVAIFQGLELQAALDPGADMAPASRVVEALLEGSFVGARPGAE